MPIHVVCPACEAINRVPEDRLARDWRAAKCPRCGHALIPDRPMAVGGEGLRRHIERDDLPILVDCWASRCGPCRMMAPAFEEAAARLAPGVRFLKLDTDAEAAAAQALGIRSIPTLILFRGGREIARQAGAMSAGQIAGWVGSHLKAPRLFPGSVQARPRRRPCPGPACRAGFPVGAQAISRCGRRRGVGGTICVSDRGRTAAAARRFRSRISTSFW